MTAESDKLLETPAKAIVQSSGLSALLHPRVLTMLFFGFSAGIPILLIFSSLSLWLGEAGVERKAVTFFSWAALGYSFKFIWAPPRMVVVVAVRSGCGDLANGECRPRRRGSISDRDGPRRRVAGIFIRYPRYCHRRLSHRVRTG